MLEADIEAAQGEQQPQRRYLSYDVFLQHYWAHFSQSLTKGLGMIVPITPVKFPLNNAL